MRSLLRVHYRDRREAGRVLGERLASFAGRRDLLVLGLPRGGVPVAWEVARRLGAPVDVGLVLQALLLAVAGGLIAGTLGGLRAARLRPADALRSVE